MRYFILSLLLLPQFIDAKPMLPPPASESWILDETDGNNELHASASSGSFGFGSGVTVIELSSGYLRRVAPAFMAGGDLDFVAVNTDGFSGNAIGILGIGEYLIEPDNFNRSFYAMAGIGVGSATARFSLGESSKTSFGFRLGGGKRFPLAKNLYLRPEAYLQKFADDDSMTFVLRFIDLTFRW